MTDFPDLPKFLDRKVNGLVSQQPIVQRGPRAIWPKKRNWAKIAKRRREQEKRENTALLAGCFKIRRGA